jgi:hypothetical protein
LEPNPRINVSAQERSRTSTPLRALAPEASASAIPPLGRRSVLLNRVLRLYQMLTRLTIVANFVSIDVTMRKFIFGTTFLFLAPFGLVFLLVTVLAIYEFNATSSNLTAMNTVAYAALPTSQNIQSAEITQGDGRVERLREFFAAYNSPLEPFAQDVVAAADEYGLDFRLVPSIAMQESGLCKTIPDNSYNCWGFGVYNHTAVHFDSYKDGIYTVTKALATRYKDKGLVTPQQIMTMYTPSSNGSWAFGVNTFMQQLQ